jgi:hypothetical protein
MKSRAEASYFDMSQTSVNIIRMSTIGKSSTYIVLRGICELVNLITLTHKTLDVITLRGDNCNKSAHTLSFIFIIHA